MVSSLKKQIPLVELSDILAKIDTDNRSILRVVEEISLETPLLYTSPYTSPYIDGTWYVVLREAELQGKLEDLLKAILRKYPKNRELRAFLDRYDPELVASIGRDIWLAGGGFVGRDRVISIGGLFIPRWFVWAYGILAILIGFFVTRYFEVYLVDNLSTSTPTPMSSIGLSMSTSSPLLPSPALASTFTSMPSPTLTPTPLIPPGIVITQTVIPTATFELVEAEWPQEMDLRDTGTIRLALIRTSDNAYQPFIEREGNAGVVATIQPVGTPQVLLKDAYGPGYHAYAAAKLVNSAFTITLVSPEVQPFDERRLDWIWSISPKQEGQHTLNASVAVMWVSGSSSPITKTTVSDSPLQRQVWHGYFDVNVTRPVFTWGSYTVLEIWRELFGAGAFGAFLSFMALKGVPWLAQRLRDQKPAVGTAYLTTAETANQLGVSVEKVRELCNQKQLSDAQRLSSGQWRIPTKSVEKWKAKNPNPTS